MQRVTNCILTDGNEVLLLKKPRRGWWVAPGGKMEFGESIRESVNREFFEETGIHLKNAKLRGVFTIVIEDKGKPVNEWMLFTFHATVFAGELLKESPEGALAWQPKEIINELPMAPGDYHIFKHVFEEENLIYGTFTYTKDNKLINYRLDVDGKPNKVQQNI